MFHASRHHLIFSHDDQEPLDEETQMAVLNAEHASALGRLLHHLHVCI